MALASVLPAALDAAGWSEPEAPDVLLGDPVPLVDDGELLLGEVADEPDDPEPIVPEAPEVPLVDDGELLLGEVADEPDDPDPIVPDDPEDMPEAPVLPAVPASFLFCVLGLDVLLPEVDPMLEDVCATTTEDTDATKTNDRDRIVFNVMSNSLS